MFRPIQALPAVLSAALLVFAAHAPAAETILPDRIIRTTSDVPLSGIKILGADVSGITYTNFSRPVNPAKINREEISEVIWGDTPADLRRALQQLKEGQAEPALRTIENLPETGPRDFWYQPYRYFVHGQCLMELKNYAAAIPKFDEVIRRHARSFYMLDAVQAKIRAHKALRQYDSVVETAALLDPKNAVGNPDVTEPYGKLWQLRGQVERAEAFVLSGKPAQAAQVYEGLAEAAEVILTEPPANLKGATTEIGVIRQRALVGGAEALIAIDTDKAEEWIARIGDKIIDKSVRLRLHMAAGDLLTEDAKKLPEGEEKRLKYTKAMLAYMRVYILYPDQKEARPGAMLKAAVASGMVGAPADKARAARIARELIAEFPNSEEAKAAAGLLGSLGVKAP